MLWDKRGNIYSTQKESERDRGGPGCEWGNGNERENVCCVAASESDET